MRLSRKRTSGRVAATVNRAAAGSEVPAGQDPSALSATTARERGVMRRRVRRLRRVRELLLHELGALVFEMERRGVRREALLRRKVDQLRVIEDEAAALAAALGDQRSLSEIVSAGIVGACHNCGTLVSTDARFCSNCATSVTTQAQTSAPAVAGPPGPDAPATTTAPAPGAPGTSAPAPPATATLPTEGAQPAGPAGASPDGPADRGHPEPRPGAANQTPDPSDPGAPRGASREAAGDVPHKAADAPNPETVSTGDGTDGPREANGGTPDPEGGGAPGDGEAPLPPGRPLTRG